LDSDTKEVILHGLGAAINRTCNLALYLQKIHCDTLEFDIKTSSVNLIGKLLLQKQHIKYILYK
jgi:hypothetical protein